MNKCKYCNGKFKMTKKEHLIRSRNQQKSEMIFEDLYTLVCTVCGHTELTETSETYVNFFREKIRRELSNPTRYNSIADEKKLDKLTPIRNTDKIDLTFFKNTIRKWIG